MHDHPHRYAMDAPDDADTQHERHQMSREVDDYLLQQEQEGEQECGVCGHGVGYHDNTGCNAFIGGYPCDCL